VWSFGDPQLTFQAGVLAAIGVAVLLLGVWGYLGDRFEQAVAGMAKASGSG